MMRDRQQRRVARRHAHVHSVGIFDDTSYVKKGDKTACVQRQYCGAVGKRENCVVSVHLGYATPTFHSLLDGELYLPKDTWHADRQRCRQAGISDEVVYRGKHQIALDQYRRALGNGVRFAWLTFDEFYGRSKQFLRELDGMGQNYVAEVPQDFHVWTRSPAVRHREHARDGPAGPDGRRRKSRRLKKQHNPMLTVQAVAAYSPVMRRQPAVLYQVKDGSKGPMVWRVKHLLVYLQDEHGLPTRAQHLLVAWNALDPTEVKYFTSNAPEGTAVSTLLQVAFSRWKIERMFEDSKMELGLDHFEVRKYRSISRHLILSCVSHLFLAEFHQEHADAGEKKRADDQPGGYGNPPTGGDVGTWGPLFAKAGRSDQRATDDNAAAQRESRPQPSQADDPEIARDWCGLEPDPEVSVAEVIAL
jgi:SRSO17 transposase